MDDDPISLSDEPGGDPPSPGGGGDPGASGRPDVIEVEAVPMEGEDGESSPVGGEAGGAAGVGHAFGPIIAGAIIDMLDLATFGTIGLYAGFGLGFAAGTWLCRYMGLRWKTSLGIGVLCGVYCTIPVTTPIPLATLIGAFARFRGRG